MDWKPAILALEETKAPRGYELGLLERSEVQPVTERLRDWYPDLAVSSERDHLTPAFYFEQTALADVEDDRPVFPVVARRDGTVVALITFEKDVSCTLMCRVGVVAPDHRGVPLASLGPILLERIGRAMGAELVYYFATLQSAHQQVLAERFRYKLVGIVPALDRGVTASGAIKRVYEAIYAKVLVDEGSIEAPPADALTVRTRAVWDALFGTK